MVVNQFDYHFYSSHVDGISFIKFLFQVIFINIIFLIMTKKVIKLTTSDLSNMIKESVSNILKEYNSEVDNYYGGGLPGHDFDDDEPENDRITIDDLAKLEKYCDGMADIANNRSDDCGEIFSCLDTIDEFIQRKKNELLNFSKH